MARKKALEAEGTFAMRAIPPFLDGVPLWHEYFYEGELVVRDGRVDCPKSRPEWVGRLLNMGYEFMNAQDAAEWANGL